MFNKVISILGTLILLVLAGCRDVAPISVEEPSTENRTITLNLDITTRADNLPPDNSEPDIIRLWIFDNNEKNLIKYVVSSQNVWTPVTDGIDIKTTLQTEIEADDINEKSTFKIYLVLNQPFEKDSTTPVDFTNVTSIKDLKQKTFVLTEYEGDNKVPMTGEGTAKFSPVKGNKMIFSTSIYAKRCVAKLGIYCTKGNPSSSSTLTINQVTLSKVPNKGYLFETDSNTSIYYTGTKDLLSTTNPITVTKSYTEKMPSYSSNSWNETAEGSFEEISSPYLLENPNGEVTGDGFLQVNGLIPDERYCITLSYTLNGAEYTQKIYVSQIERNQYSKIYIRINDAITVNDICCQVNSWTEHEMDVPAFK